MQLQQTLLDYISQSLLTINETVSVAETVTSGFLQFSFSQMQNASLFYKGGLTAYTLEEKVKILNVDRKEAEECDGVSQKIANTMALSVAKLFSTQWSIAITGFATPSRYSDYNLFSFFSINYKNEIVLSKRIELPYKTSAMKAQLYYAEFILGCFKSKLNQQLILK
ncbi:MULTISPECIES: CinA family protein [Chryseobacterium]|uniref:CinA family protein n=1 Tax=Chryseobacterium TaxID=59732 RepID=UPI001BEAECBD|nr:MULTISPECIES: nicotinamide-nucleotide amidohydrolase family protein [Chryseobacterium]MBT2619451.1 nicotinamide-nucleotide amidohydrolase family protein [Chryseobacterium sp. ISL-6]